LAYVANVAKAKTMIGKLVGDGQCVTFIHAAVAIPATSFWRPGPKVSGNLALALGTVIATFDPNGRYGNHLDGRSHAAIYLGQDAFGIRVLDQWKGRTVQPVHFRTIRFKHGHGDKANDGDQFYVVQ